MKVKEAEQQGKKDFERNLSFEEWLEYFNKEPNSKDLNDMESNALKPRNNPYYHPVQGA